MKNHYKLIKLTLLLTSMMTMMAGAVVAPSLPQIKKVFAHLPNAELFTKLILTLPALFVAFFSPLAGNLIDKFGRKKLLVFSLILYAVSGTSGFYLLNLYAILVGRAMLGISVAGIITIATTLIGDYYTGEKRSAFMGLLGAFMGFGGVLFIAIAGLLADIQWQMPFLIYTFSIPVLVLVIIFIYETHKPQKSVNMLNKQQKVIAYPRLLVYKIYMIIFIGIIFFYMVPVQIPFLLKKIEGLSNSKVGYAISLFTLTSALVSINYKRIKKRLSFNLIYCLTFLFIGIGYVFISFSVRYYQYIISLMISGLGLGLLMPSGNLWIMEIAPENIRGQLIGKASTATFLGQFFSPIFVQFIVIKTTLNNTFLIAGIIMMLLSSAFFIYHKK